MSTPAFEDALIMIKSRIAASDTELQEALSVFKARAASAKISADDIYPSEIVIDDWLSDANVGRIVHRISVLKNFYHELLEHFVRKTSDS